VSRLLSVSEAKLHLGLSVATDNYPIGEMIDAAARAMEGYAGRHLISTSRTEVLNGRGRVSLWLAEPAESVTSVHESSSQSWTEATLVDSDDYYVDGCQVERLDGIWLNAQRGVRAVYAVGYATVPDDLKQACKIQVGVWYAEWQRTKEGLDNLARIRAETLDRAYAPQTDLDPRAKAILDAGYIPARL